MDNIVCDGWSLTYRLLGGVPVIVLRDESGTNKVVDATSEPMLFRFLDALYKEHEE